MLNCYHLKKRLSPEDFEKLDIDSDVTYTAIQTGGYCTSHAQISALGKDYKDAKAFTPEDFTQDLLWTAQKAEELCDLFDIDPKTSQIAQRAYGISEAVKTDVRRVYWNNPELYHHYAPLPVAEGRRMVTPERVTVIPASDDCYSHKYIIKPGLRHMGHEELREGIDAGKEYRLLLQARRVADEKLHQLHRDNPAPTQEESSALKIQNAFRQFRKRQISEA